MELKELVEQLGTTVVEFKAQYGDRLNSIENYLAKMEAPMGGAIKRNTGPFRDFGDQMLAVFQAGKPGNQVDPRLYEVHKIMAATGASEGIPSDGGFLVQQDFSNDLLKTVFETGKLGKLCQRVTISANSNSIKLNAFDESSRVSSRFGGIVSYWISEASLKTASAPKFRQLELNLKKLVGLCYSSDELLQDVTALRKILSDAFVSEFGFKIDDAIIRGTGAGQPLGILNADCLVSVAKETGQHARTIMTENIVKMWARLLPGSEDSCVWLINKNVLPQLFTMSLAVGTGGIPVYMPANSFANQPYQTLMGRPILPIEQCATLGTVGDIILADFKNGYVLAQKGNVQADVSIHVMFVYDESVFRFVMRLDGQPVLSSALTPYKGGATSTQSHFVALATRG